MRQAFREFIFRKLEFENTSKSPWLQVLSSTLTMFLIGSHDGSQPSSYHICEIISQPLPGFFRMRAISSQPLRHSHGRPGHFYDYFSAAYLPSLSHEIYARRRSMFLLPTRPHVKCAALTGNDDIGREWSPLSTARFGRSLWRIYHAILLRPTMLIEWCC